MIESLCDRLAMAIAQEKAAKKERLEAEEALLKSVPKKLEGTETLKTTNYKVSVSYKLNRCLDYDAYKALELPEHLGFVDLKPSINLKNLRVIERVDPALVAKCITIKQSKPSIKLEVA